MAPKIHYLIPLSKPQMGIEFKAACQRAFRFSAAKQLRGSQDLAEVTCSKCRQSGLFVQAAIRNAATGQRERGVSEVAHRHIVHAAHGYLSGAPLWDLDVYEVRGSRDSIRGAWPADPPHNAEYDSGFIGKDGAQYSTYMRKTPASLGRCARCPEEPTV